MNKIVYIAVGVCVVGYFLWAKLKGKIPNHERAEIVSLCKINKPIIDQYLYLSGKSGLEKKLLGKVEGSHVDKSKKEHEIYILFKQKKENFVFKGVKKDFVDSKIIFKDGIESSDKAIIKLIGMTFAPEDDGFVSLAKPLGLKEINLKDEYNYDLEEAQDDFVILSQKSIDISPHHQKHLESSQMFNDATESERLFKDGQGQAGTPETDKD